MNNYCKNMAWIVFGIFCGTFVNSWIYALTIGIIGIIFIIYVEFAILGVNE